MNDHEDLDFITEPWMSPPKGKDQKKNKKNVKHKKSRPIKPHEKVQKEKKKSKLKEKMMEKREKTKEKRKEKDRDEKKGKKKKKKNFALNLDDFKFIESSQRLSAGSQHKHQNSSTEKSVKEPKSKKSQKTVAFGLLPSYIPVKRPILTSSALKQTKAVRQEESGSWAMRKGQIQPQENDSQYNSDDINSQDLFITQKRFRASPSETSSSEASERVISESPHSFTQRDKNQHAAAGEIKRCNETSDKGRERAIKTEQMVEDIHEFLKSSREISFLINQAEIKVSEHEGHQLGNPLLDDPLVINPTPDAVLFQDGSSYRSHAGEPPMTRDVRSTSTQTEGFFTTELSSYLSYCRKHRTTLQSQDLKPLDLSMPHRARNIVCLSGETLDADIKLEEENSHEQEPSSQKGEINSNRKESICASHQTKHAEMKKETLCPGEETPSPQSEAESKSANTTSSEDDQNCRAGKRDLSQVGAVQLRLNKPFFFKTKGEGQSPRPESPLMKLALGREAKTKKCRSGRK